MLRLAHLEYLKLRKSKAMWILLGLYFLTIAAISFGAGQFLEYLANQGVEYRGLDPTILPIYDFEDIWQNLAYLAYFFKVFPAFLLIISVSNEFSYKTNRQNIIDGLSRTEFFISKLSFAGFLALSSAVILFLMGTLLGVLHSNIMSFTAFARNLEFIGGHALQLFIYFLFAILLVLLIKRSGITIVLLLLYSVVIEPLLALWIRVKFPSLGPILPLDSISSIVPVPFSKYLLFYTEDFIPLPELGKATLWGAIFILLIFWILKKKDF